MENFLQMLQQIFEVCVIPLLGILTAYLVQYIATKKDALIKQNDNALATKYITMLSKTITDCVIATNQTYVDSLKAQGKFDAEAQKKAFNMTLTAVLSILNDEAKEYLTAIYGDLNTYITKQIEAAVNKNKTTIEPK